MTVFLLVQYLFVLEASHFCGGHQIIDMREHIGGVCDCLTLTLTHKMHPIKSCLIKTCSLAPNLLAFSFYFHHHFLTDWRNKIME